MPPVYNTSHWFQYMLFNIYFMEWCLKSFSGFIERRQEVEVKKQSYVTEEIIAKKKPVTKTKTVSEDFITEKLKNQAETQPEQDLME